MMLGRLCRRQVIVLIRMVGVDAKEGFKGMSTTPVKCFIRFWSVPGSRLTGVLVTRRVWMIRPVRVDAGIVSRSEKMS